MDKEATMSATDDPVFSLHRYYIWANNLRALYDQYITTEWDKDKEQPFDVVLHNYLSYWYAGLYVVIEGWGNLNLSDPAIDGLLESPNVQLLKRYRNGVFHFQKNYFDERFLTLIRDGEDVVTWICSLREELSRFFLHWLRSRDQQVP